MLGVIKMCKRYLVKSLFIGYPFFEVDYYLFDTFKNKEYTLLGYPLRFDDLDKAYNLADKLNKVSDYL